MSTNQPLPIAQDTTEFDPFEAATEAQARTFDLFGMVEISAWACSFQKGIKGPIPFDPTNPNHKRFTAVDVFIQPLAEIDVKYPKTLEGHWTAEFPDWTKITLPSIKNAYQRATGQEIGSVKQINGMWARVAKVPTGKKYEAKDRATGIPTGEMKDELTMKFVELYADENQCRASYTAAGGQPMQGGSSAVAPSQEQSDKNAAMAFLPVIVKNALNGKGLKISDDWKAAVTTALTQFPMVAKHFTADAPEVANYALPLLQA